MGPANPVIMDSNDFRERLEAFVANFPTSEQNEKARLLVHHWLDALACWSLEDLVLSAATMLEIFAATAERVSVAAGSGKLQYFTPRIDYAATRYGMTPLGNDFRNMRNDLVHDGHLSGKKFPNKDLAACAAATSEALNWIDEYMHNALNLGTPSRQRFDATTFQSLNAFSL